METLAEVRSSKLHLGVLESQAGTWLTPMRCRLKLLRALSLERGASFQATR